MIIFRSSLFRMRNVSDTIFIEHKRKFRLQNIFFSKIVPFKRYVEKYGTATQATDGDIIRRMHFACLITKATDTLRLLNTYCFFMAAILCERATILC